MDGDPGAGVGLVPAPRVAGCDASPDLRARWKAGWRVRGFYRNQDEKSKLASSYNRLVTDENRQWRVLFNSTVTADAPLLEGPSSLLQGHETGLLVWHWYWLGDDRVTASLMRAKLDLAVARLTRRSDTSAWVAVFTPAGEVPAEAQAALSAFLRDNARNLDAALKATAAR